MPLLELWSSNPAAIGQFSIEQIVAAAGSGDLRDNSSCSEELRSYFTQVASEKLAEYIERCLDSHFPRSGYALQDLINELGTRLEYRVTNGRYQGTVNSIGYDGIWVSPEGQTIIVEVKTTDAYRISLDTIAGYREKLLSAGQIKLPASILIVVGREDTGELEAQVRGSRHAWDMRLISAGALIKLVQLKENAEGQETAGKIRSLIVPREYTRLDDMVDVMFATAKDVEAVTEALASEEDDEFIAANIVEKVKGTWQFTDSNALQAKREQIAVAMSRPDGAPLLKKSRALYWSADHAKRAAITLSKRYARKGGPHYWYAYHTQWDDFLREGDGPCYLVLGCMDRNEAFAIPSDVFRALMQDLNITSNDDRTHYWHVQLTEAASGSVSLLVPKQTSNLELAQYAVKLGT
jgi:hypothetical protein